LIQLFNFLYNAIEVATSDSYTCGTATCSDGQVCDSSNNVCYDACPSNNTLFSATDSDYCGCISSDESTATLCSVEQYCDTTEYVCGSEDSTKNVGNLEAKFIGKSGKVLFYDKNEGESSGFQISWDQVKEVSSIDSKNKVWGTTSIAATPFVYSTTSSETNISTVMNVKGS